MNSTAIMSSSKSKSGNISTRADECIVESGKGIVLERVLHVNISNSMGNLALAGPHGGFWKPVDGTQFQILGQAMEGMDSSAATHQLSNAMIHEVTLLEHQSSFPVPLGVQISCVPANEFTELGEAYAYTVLPTSTMSVPQSVYKSPPLSEDMYEWKKEFPKYNATNLEAEGIMHVNNQAFVFIDCEHPVVSVLRHNAQLIGCDIDSQKKLEGNWYKVSKPVLKTCCDSLRQKVLSKMQTQDLNTLSVQIHRLNASGWEDLGDGSLAMKNFKIKASASPEEEEEAKRKHLRQFTSTPFSYMARIKIKYELDGKV